MARPTGLAARTGVLVLLMASGATIWAGCSSDDPARPADPVQSATVTLTAEPLFTAGNSNTLHWTVADAPHGNPPAGALPVGWTFQIERAADPGFAEAEASPWLAADHHTFDGLADGSTYHYRVKARGASGTESAWSTSVNSTQDATPPVAAVLALTDDQTSLLFDLEVTAVDATSGIAEVALWVRRNGGQWEHHGPVAPGSVRFQTDSGGPHEFSAVATDMAGNAQVRAAFAQAATVVPEPIFLVDTDGFAWDITNAVLKHGIHLDWWGHGLGRFTIRPVIDPDLIGPGDPRWPGPDNLADVVAVNLGGDARAYRIGDLPDREVVNDVVNGEPIAATY